MNTTDYPTIALGTRVHCILYGGKDGTIVAIHGETMPDTIVNFPGLTSGGNAEYDIIWDNLSRSQRIPECIIRGVQWRAPDLPRYTNERILELIELAGRKEDSDRIAEQEKKAAMAARREQLIQDHPTLEIGEGAKIAAKNIRAQLKQAFGWVKFSVRSDHNSISIGWADGPTIAEVEAITSRYSEGRFDGMNDCYEYDHERVWPFGGARYLFTARDMGDQAREDGTRVIAEHYSDDTDRGRELYQHYRQTTIPAGHRIDGIAGEAFNTRPQ
jgi:hypothetical protein